MTRMVYDKQLHEKLGPRSVGLSISFAPCTFAKRWIYQMVATSQNGNHLIKWQFLNLLVNWLDQFIKWFEHFVKWVNFTNWAVQLHSEATERVCRSQARTTLVPID